LAIRVRKVPRTSNRAFRTGPQSSNERPRIETSPSALGSPLAAASRLEPGRLADAVEILERQLIGSTLERTGGNISETARVLGLTRRGLHLKMRRLGLESIVAGL
jgi:DNA-binding NtrC family response regulator